jgi:galactose mutarotase-like enzyme
VTSLQLRQGSAVATIALHGAEPLSWQVGGRELVWHGDPAHWSGRAPILFPVVGASVGGEVRVDGESYPMPQHGFARGLDFAVVSRGEHTAHLRLGDSPDTRQHYPFAFRLDVVATLSESELRFDYEVDNPGSVDLPYALGFHPAFPWPFMAGDNKGYRVEFEAAEEPFVPTIREMGILDMTPRPVPLQGRILDLTPERFAEGAMVFREARSRVMRFVAPSGEAIEMAVEDFPHLALWTRPTAPFLSLEAWTGHADWVGFSGELRERNTIRLVAPGSSARHAVTLSWREA